MPSVFIWTPDQGASREHKLTVERAKFGDGYEQRSSDLLNSVKQVWSLNFTLRTKSEILAISTFLTNLKGVSNFLWTTPAGEELLFTCDKWSDTFNHDGDNSLSATFEQDFGL